MYSAICSEFGCTPREALNQPAVLTERIMEARRFTEAYAALTTPVREGEEAPPTPPEPWHGDVMDFVREDFDRRQEERRG